MDDFYEVHEVSVKLFLDIWFLLWLICQLMYHFGLTMDDISTFYILETLILSLSFTFYGYIHHSNNE